MALPLSPEPRPQQPTTDTAVSLERGDSASRSASAHSDAGSGTAGVDESTVFTAFLIWANDDPDGANPLNPDIFSTAERAFLAGWRAALAISPETLDTADRS